MPKSFYAGDSVAVKLAAINLVNTGSFGIEFSRRPQLESFLAEKGLLFHENVTRQKFYSRWGWLNTAISAVPVLFQAKRSFPIRIEDAVFAHNWMNAIIGALAGIYLVLLAEMISGSFPLALVYALTCLYGTFAWNYLRAQSYELIHLFFFLGLCYHLLVFLSPSPAKGRLHRYVWKLFAAALVLSKAFYFIVFPPMLYAIYFARGVQNKDGKERFSSALLEVGGIFVITTAATFIGNNWQFESPLIFGVGRHSELWSMPVWSFGYYGSRLHDYFVNPSTNLFLCFPPLILAVAGWYRFHQTHGVASRLLMSTFLLTLVVLGGFYDRGEWCYGPRFFLFLLPAMALAALPVLEHAIRNLKKPLMAILISCCLLVAFVSVQMQLLVNRHPFFLKHRVHDLFWALHNEDPIEEYFRSYPIPLIVRDIERFERGERIFFPVQHFMETHQPETWASYELFVRNKLLELDSGNYLWKN